MRCNSVLDSCRATPSLRCASRETGLLHRAGSSRGRRIPLRSRRTFQADNAYVHKLLLDSSTASFRREIRIRKGVIARASTEEKESVEEEQLDLFSVENLSRKWDVPWGGKVLLSGSLLWVSAFIGIGLFLTPEIADQFHLQYRDPTATNDKAYFLLIDQVCETVFGIGLIWALTRPYTPLSPNLFRISAKDPFDLKEGWLLWALIGILASLMGVGITAYLVSLLNSPSSQSTGTAEAVASILTKDPRAFLSIFAVTSLLAPLLEEVIFRGFVMTTLTKWLPTPTAAFVSAGFFGAAHLTSHDFAQLTALGVILGLTYSRTQNLLTPIFIHAFWNSGVLVLLEVLLLSGYDIQDLLK